MNNFPFFQHQVIKVIFQDNVPINEVLIDQVAQTLIDKFQLKVVNQTKHEFTNEGLTKCWILSQSHLIIHSWPENNALHIDLMTCSSLAITAESLQQSLDSFPLKDIISTKLEY